MNKYAMDLPFTQKLIILNNGRKTGPERFNCDKPETLGDCQSTNIVNIN